LNQAGLNLSGARLIAPGLFTNGVPAFTADARGNFLVSVGPTGSSFGRWSFSSLSYQLLRTNGVLALTNLNAISANSALNSSLAFTGFVNSAGVVDLRAAKTEGFFGGFQLASLDVGLKRGVGNLRSVILAGEPLAYWRLGEGGKTATVAVSETGSKFDGTYQIGSEIGHPGALVGDANTAARFDGQGGRVVVGNESLFDKIGPALTVEAWIKVNAFDRTWNTIIAKGDSSWRLQRNGNTDVAQQFHLLGGSFAKGGDDGPGMAHLAPLRCRKAGDIGDDRFVHMVPHPGRSFCFLRAADFSDHHHCIGIRVCGEQRQNIPEA
jgi:hypothetical protein